MVSVSSDPVKICNMLSLVDQEAMVSFEPPQDEVLGPPKASGFWACLQRQNITYAIAWQRVSKCLSVGLFKFLRDVTSLHITCLTAPRLLKRKPTSSN